MEMLSAAMDTCRSSQSTSGIDNAKDAASHPNEKRNGFLHLGRGAASELIINPEFYPGFETTELIAFGDSALWGLPTRQAS